MSDTPPFGPAVGAEDRSLLPKLPRRNVLRLAVAGATIVGYVALAGFDPSESLEGWTDAGHLQSAYEGWVEVTFE